MQRPTLPQPKRKPEPKRAPPLPGQRPVPGKPRPLPPKPQMVFSVEPFDDGWWRAVDERGHPVWKEGFPGIRWPITGNSAERVRARMQEECTNWREAI